MDLSARELKEFEHAFKMLDLESDGSVTTKDLGRFMRTLGRRPTDSELQSIINEIDEDGNGAVEFNEFVKAMTHRMSQMPNDEELREAFRLYDRENTGYITSDNIRTIFLDFNTKLDEEEIEEMIREADEDGDGALNFEDFVQMMTTM